MKEFFGSVLWFIISTGLAAFLFSYAYYRLVPGWYRRLVLGGYSLWFLAGVGVIVKELFFVE